MKKAVVLVVVVGVILALVALALAAMNLMTQESRVAEHKIKRMRAFYAVEAAKVDALERLRRGINPGCAAFPPTVASPCAYNVNIGTDPASPATTLVGYPLGGYNVTVRICRRGSNCYGTIGVPAITLRCPAGAASEWCVFADLPSY